MYVPLDPSQLPGTDYYNDVNGHEISVQAKLKCKEKFTEKFLVWQAISSNGRVSQSYVCKGTINGDMYKTKCIPLLLKLINDIGDRNSVIFWPDMATAHYRADVVQLLEKEGIDYVSKKDNLPNCPQLRPIEKFWAICKSKYKLLKTKSTSIMSFKQRWTRISKAVSHNSGAELFSNFKTRLTRVGKFGIDSIL